MKITVEIELEHVSGKKHPEDVVIPALVDAVEDLGEFWVDDTCYEIKSAGYRP